MISYIFSGIPFSYPSGRERRKKSNVSASESHFWGSEEEEEEEEGEQEEEDEAVKVGVEEAFVVLWEAERWVSEAIT